MLKKETRLHEWFSHKRFEHRQWAGIWTWNPVERWAGRGLKRNYSQPQRWLFLAMLQNKKAQTLFEHPGGEVTIQLIPRGRETPMGARKMFTKKLRLE
jgi:hypothetical protein